MFYHTFRRLCCYSRTVQILNLVPQSKVLLEPLKSITISWSEPRDWQYRSTAAIRRHQFEYQSSSRPAPSRQKYESHDGGVKVRTFCCHPHRRARVDVRDQTGGVDVAAPRYRGGTDARRPFRALICSLSSARKLFEIWELFLWPAETRCHNTKSSFFCFLVFSNFTLTLVSTPDHCAWSSRVWNDSEKTNGRLHRLYLTRRLS